MQPPFPIPFDEWKKLVDNISESAGTVSDRYLIPGDELGEPTAKITNSHVSDFVFPWRGGILVTEKTRRIIEGTKLSGYKLVKIVLINSKRNKFLNLPLPALYVLIVTGRIKPPQKVDRCYVCGRFKANYSIELSEGKWDGNDFIIDENYPDLIFVTERVCTVFKENGLQNYMCKPI